MKKGGKGLKNVSFWAIISKNFAGGLPTTPLGKKMKKGKEKRRKITFKEGERPENASFWAITSKPPPAANLLVGEKKLI